MATNDSVALAAELAAGYRALADFLETNPELAEHMRYTVATNTILVPMSGEDDPRALIGQFTRAGLRAGATIDKKHSDKYAGAVASWGRVRLEAYAPREEVCERVVTGVETVTKTVPDPEKLAAVPTVEVTEEVEKVEWICRPLLANDTREPSQ